MVRKTLRNVGKAQIFLEAMKGIRKTSWMP
jgi:hypothetical protein